LDVTPDPLWRYAYWSSRSLFMAGSDGFFSVFYGV